MSYRTQAIDGTVMHDGLKPAINTAVFSLIGGSLAPDGEENLLHNILSGSAFLEKTISQSISVAIVALVEDFHSLFRATANGINKLFVTGVVGERLSLGNWLSDLQYWLQAFKQRSRCQRCRYRCGNCQSCHVFSPSRS